MIYNLSTHFCDVKGVEVEPRMKLLNDIKNTQEVIKNVKDGIKGVPKGASVLLGGSNQYVGILIKLAGMMRWKVYYYNPVGNEVFTAAFLSREDVFEIERQVIAESKSKDL